MLDKFILLNMLSSENKDIIIIMAIESSHWLIIGKMVS